MRKSKKSFFTLLEVLVSMGVFSLLMLALMQFFSAAQGVWERTGNKAELFESAKTVMDIIANDLACAYYEMDHDSTYQFFNISSSDTTQIVFATQKEDGNAQLFYKWDNSSWKLHRIEKKESDVFTSGTATPSGNWFTRSGKTGWIAEMAGTALTDSNCLAENVFTAGTATPSGNWFTRSGKTAWITDMTGPSGSPAWKNDSYNLAENVLDFRVTAYKRGALTTPISVSTSASDKFPDIVMVSMTILSNDAHEKLLNRLTNDAGIKAFFDGSSKFKYLKADGTESTDEKSIKEILNAGGTLTEGDDTTQMILFKGCQRFTRAVSLVDRVPYP